jgi:hypothetical protein
MLDSQRKPCHCPRKGFQPRSLLPDALRGACRLREQWFVSAFVPCQTELPSIVSALSRYVVGDGRASHGLGDAVTVVW